MARPHKKGIPYFSLDSDISFSDEVKSIEAELGITGYAVLLKLLERIYKEEGYFIEISEKFLKVFARDLNMPKSDVKKMILVFVEEEFFDKELFDNRTILTSKRIQRNFQSATGRRKHVEINRAYILLDREEAFLDKRYIIIDENEEEIESDFNVKNPDDAPF